MPPLLDASEERALLVAAESIQVATCPRKTRCQSERESKEDCQPHEQRHAPKVKPGDIPIAIGQHCCRDLPTARENDHAAAVHRECSEGSDDCWDSKDSDQQSVHDTERASDRTSDEQHKED